MFKRKPSQGTPKRRIRLGAQLSSSASWQKGNCLLFITKTWEIMKFIQEDNFLAHLIRSTAPRSPPLVHRSTHSANIFWLCNIAAWNLFVVLAISLPVDRQLAAAAVCWMLDDCSSCWLLTARPYPRDLQFLSPTNESDARLSLPTRTLLSNFGCFFAALLTEILSVWPPLPRSQLSSCNSLALFNLQFAGNW